MLKESKLTNNEILEVAKSKGWSGDSGFLISFAKAILRKEQEKMSIEFSDDANFYYQYPANVEIVEFKDIKNSLEQLAK